MADPLRRLAEALRRRGALWLLLQCPAWAGAFAHTGARLEPADGTILHGAQAGASSVALWERPDWDVTSIPDYERAAGAKPLLLVHYLSLTDGEPALRGKLKSISDTAARGRAPVIGLAFHAPVIADGRETGARRDLCREIASGAFDERLTAIGKHLAGLPGAVFLRPGYEFGPGGDGSAYDQAAYPEAFRRAVSLIRAAGAGGVAVIWHQGKARDPLSWYPGDAVVDWWGLSIFQRAGGESRSFAAEAARHGKPLLVGEASPRDEGSAGPDAWKSWYQPFFDFLEGTPPVKGFCYLNNSWTGWRGWKDARLEGDHGTARRYRAEIAKPAFLHAGERPPAPRFWGPAFDLAQGLTVAAAGENRAEVSWKTISVAGAAAECRGRVTWRPAGTGATDTQTSAAEERAGDTHRVVIGGLETGREYQIQALCDAGGGLTIGSPPRRYMHPAPAAAGGP